MVMMSTSWTRGEVEKTTFDINNFAISLNYHNGSDTVTQGRFPC